AMSIITNVFTGKTERARAIGVWSGAYGLSLSLGPVVGGLLVDTIGWRGTFYVNIPVGLAAIALTARFVPESRAPAPPRPRPVGPALHRVHRGPPPHGDRGGPAARGPGAVVRGVVGAPPRRLGGVRGLRGPPRRARARPAVLPQRAVRGRGADRDQRHRRH